MVSRYVADADDDNILYSANVMQVDFEYILGERERLFSVGVEALLDDY